MLTVVGRVSSRDRFSSAHLFAFIIYNVILITILIMHLAGSPGGYFAYLKDRCEVTDVTS